MVTVVSDVVILVNSKMNSFFSVSVSYLDVKIAFNELLDFSMRALFSSIEV